MAYMKKFKALKAGTEEFIEVEADYYMVAEALNHSPIMAHSQKKLWDCGNRNGGKSYLQDVREIGNQCNMELLRNGETPLLTKPPERQGALAKDADHIYSVDELERIKLKIQGVLGFMDGFTNLNHMELEIKKSLEDLV